MAGIQRRLPLLIGWCTAAILFAQTPPTGSSGNQRRPNTRELPTPASSRQATAPTGSTSGTDSEVESAIRARFAQSKISVNGFAVRVRSGIATLTGRTQIPQHKGTATLLAKRAGAKRVVNRIQVNRPAVPKAAVPAEQPLAAAPKAPEIKRAKVKQAR